jgi:hypothetical protein
MIKVNIHQSSMISASEGPISTVEIAAVRIKCPFASACRPRGDGLGTRLHHASQAWTGEDITGAAIAASGRHFDLVAFSMNSQSPVPLTDRSAS